MSKKSKRKRKDAAVKPMEPDSHVIDARSIGTDSNSVVEISGMYLKKMTGGSHVSAANDWLRKVAPVEVNAKTEIQNINALTVGLREVSEYYLKVKDQKPEELKNINVDAFRELFERLQELKDILIPAEESKTA